MSTEQRPKLVFPISLTVYANKHANLYVVANRLFAIYLPDDKYSFQNKRSVIIKTLKNLATNQKTSLEIAMPKRSEWMRSIYTIGEPVSFILNQS